MNAFIPSLIAVTLYLTATLYQGCALYRKRAPKQGWLLAFGLLAWLAQVIALDAQLLNEQGALLLDFFKAANLVAACVIGLTLLASLKMPVSQLFLLLFPLGAVTSLTACGAPIGTSAPIIETPGILAHILLSLCAYGLLSLALFQALLLLVQDRQLKKRHLTGFVRHFPPLQTMESLLFGFILAGWLLLTLSLGSGALFLDDLFAQHLVHKTLLSCVAWVVFGVLLWGRWRLGWRGHTAVRWTVAGFLLLMLAYFGSKLVREFILHI